MKKILYSLVALLMVTSMTSCLTSGFEELETYSGCDITGVAGIYYRYKSTATMPVSGEPKVIQKGLNYGNFTSDPEAGTCAFVWQIPSNFTADERASFSPSSLVVVVNLSTAATIKPLEGSPAFGVPGDWTKPNKYEVTAANGDTKIWTVTVTEYGK